MDATGRLLSIAPARADAARVAGMQDTYDSRHKDFVNEWMMHAVEQHVIPAGAEVCAVILDTAMRRSARAVRARYPNARLVWCEHKRDAAREAAALLSPREPTVVYQGDVFSALLPPVLASLDVICLDLCCCYETIRAHFTRVVMDAWRGCAPRAAKVIRLTVNYRGQSEAAAIRQVMDDLHDLVVTSGSHLHPIPRQCAFVKHTTENPWVPDDRQVCYAYHRMLNFVLVVQK